jgi:hypothetical protein
MKGHHLIVDYKNAIALITITNFQTIVKVQTGYWRVIRYPVAAKQPDQWKCFRQIEMPVD